MSSSNFGGSIKLTGEQEYKKALSSITQSLKVVSSEMKATASAFSNGDKSTKELAQDSKALKQSLEQQKTALNALKSYVADLVTEYNKSEKAHQELVKSYETEQKKLDQIEKSLGKSSKEYQEQAKRLMI